MKYETELLENVLKTLRSIKVRRSNLVCGICNNIIREVDRGQEEEASELMVELFESWPKFSGDSSFPIVVGHLETDADAQYLSRNSDQLWDKGTEYGRLRYELVDHMIDTIGGMLP